MNTPKRPAKGFTLIEVMITVAILGILMSIALPAYQSYTQIANTAKLNTHYEAALDLVSNEMQRIRISVQLGTEDRSTISVQRDAWSTEWETVFNTEFGTNKVAAGSPEGAPAYADAASTVDGTVGITFTGSIENSDLEVTVTRPDYGGMVGVSETVAW